MNLRLDQDVLDWISARAEADERSRAFIVMRAIRAEMARGQTKAIKPRPKR